MTNRQTRAVKAQRSTRAQQQTAHQQRLVELLQVYNTLNNGGGYEDGDLASIRAAILEELGVERVNAIVQELVPETEGVVNTKEVE